MGLLDGRMSKTRLFHSGDLNVLLGVFISLLCHEKLRDMSDLTQLFFRSVGRHFVTLSCVQRRPGTTTEHIVVVSGFLTEVAGCWIYVTAGHVLRDIQTAMRAGSEFDVWRLGDQTAGNPFDDTAIPFDFVLEKWLVIEDEETGVDYAAVALDSMYCRLLNAGGAVPLHRETWGKYVSEHDYWALVGIPSETVAYDGKTIITARIVIAPLRQAEIPEAAGNKSQNQFYAQLTEDSEGKVHDLAGMSGGPIFALKKAEEKWKYWIIGVQSGWYRSTRTITACPFSSFGEAIASEMEASKAAARL